MVSLAIALAFVGGLSLALPRASADAGLVAVLSADEALSVRIVRHMLAERTPDQDGFFAYGALLHDLAALMLAPAAALTSVSDRAIIVALRLVALLSGAAVIVLTALLGARLGGTAAGATAALFVAVTPELAEWSVTAHPDTLQLAAITAALIVAGALARKATVRRTLAAGALAGLAFSAKYAGLLLLPVLLLALAAGLSRTGGAQRPGRFLVWAVLLGAAFAAVFAVTNPSALATPHAFAGQVRAELAHAEEGHVFDEGHGGVRWLSTVASVTLGGPLMALLAAAGIALLARPAIAGTGGRLQRLLGRIDLASLSVLWVAGYFLYLVLRVGYGAPRHALPVVPVVAALAAYALVAGARMRPGSRVRSVAVLAMAGAVVAAVPLYRTAGEQRARLRAAAALDGDARVLAGRWLAQAIPPHAPVLADAYVYIPPGHNRVTVTFGLTAAQMEAVAPAVILVNEDIRGRFRWDIGAERYIDGPAAYAERQAAYAALESGGFACYQLVQDFGAVQAYRRTCP